MSITKFFAWSSSAILLVALVWICRDLILLSYREISWQYLWEAPQKAGRAGGIFPILLSTLYLLGLSLTFLIPVGLATAILLSEISQTSYQGRILRQSVQILAGVPSIVFGLFGNALFSKYLGLGFSILSGALTLFLMALPLFVLTVEFGFRRLPLHLKQSSHALALSKTTTLFKILLPQVIPAIAVALILSIGRALGETAALIFTSGYVDRIPQSAMDSGRSLAVHIYDLSMNVPGGNINAAKSSLILLILIFSVNGIINIVAHTWKGEQLLR